MKLDPLLLEILVCPDCKGSLTVDDANEELICDDCGLIYPVRDDIPVMLVDEARRPEPATSNAEKGESDDDPGDAGESGGADPTPQESDS
jgi:uncharacterized protein YbaR (Trm112 family)